MACNSNELFTSHEMKEGMGQSLDLVVGVWNILATVNNRRIIQSFNKFYVLRV